MEKTSKVGKGESVSTEELSTSENDKKKPNSSTTHSKKSEEEIASVKKEKSIESEVGEVKVNKEHLMFSCPVKVSIDLK